MAGGLMREEGILGGDLLRSGHGGGLRPAPKRPTQAQTIVGGVPIRRALLSSVLFEGVFRFGLAWRLV